MNEGISVDESCAKNVVGTPEDFERLCNSDGTAKNQSQTTAFTLKNDGSRSITINNTYMQIGIAVLLVMVMVLVGLIIRKLKIRRVS